MQPLFAISCCAWHTIFKDALYNTLQCPLQAIPFIHVVPVQGSLLFGHVLPCRQLLENFQRNRTTYQAFRPLGTREEVQALRRAIEHTLHGHIARYSGPRACTEIPITPEEEEEESRRNLERLQQQLEDGTLGAEVDTDDEGKIHGIS